MSIPMGPLQVAFAALPVAFLLILCFGWGIGKAAPLGMTAAFAIAVLCFRSSPVSLFFDMGKGVWNAAAILLVIWPALFSYELTCQVKGFQAIRRGIQSVTRHELM